MQRCLYFIIGENLLFRPLALISWSNLPRYLIDRSYATTLIRRDVSSSEVSGLAGRAKLRIPSSRGRIQCVVTSHHMAHGPWLIALTHRRRHIVFPSSINGTAAKKKTLALWGVGGLFGAQQCIQRRARTFLRITRALWHHSDGWGWDMLSPATSHPPSIPSLRHCGRIQHVCWRKQTNKAKRNPIDLYL